MATQITKHFFLEEFTFSPTASKHNIDNTPTEDVYRNILLVASQLEVVRNIYGRAIIISSGYRCKRVNDLVGGVTNSKHLKGLAVDINCGLLENSILYNILKSLRSVLCIDELINEDNYSWIHVSFKF